MSRPTLGRVAREARIYLLIAVELIFGVIGGILLVGLVPGDRVNFNVVGSLVLLVPCAVIFFFAGRRRKALTA